MNTLLTSLTVLFRNSKRSLLYGSMAAITIGLEELFESVVFRCPCEGHFAYGFAFLFAPALLLFFPGILLDRNLWRHPRRTVHEKSKIAIRRYFNVVFAAFDVFIRAGIAPTAWLVLSLLQQQYYTCAYFGPSVNSEVPVSNTSDKCYFKLGNRSKQLEESYKARSQIAGWSLMLMALVILFTTICIRRCTTKGKRLKLPSLEYYRHVEAKEALEQFHSKAKELAKQNATKTIELLFHKADKGDLDACLEEVSKNVLWKFGMFFVIPPESPAYETPVVLVDNPPQFPELFLEKDGAETVVNKYNMQTKPEHMGNSKQRTPAVHVHNHLQCPESFSETHGADTVVSKCHGQTKREDMDYSKQRQLTLENLKHGTSVSRVHLCRQISIQAV